MLDKKSFANYNIAIQTMKKEVVNLCGLSERQWLV